MNLPDFPQLETNRLLLREFALSDAADVQLLAGHYEVAINTLAMPHPYLDGMAEAWINSHEVEYLAGTSVIWAICLRSSGQLIGAIGLTIQRKYRLAELGYWIGRPFWGKGFCTEAVEVVLNYALHSAGLHKVTANHFADNPASGRVMQKAGMKYEATLKAHLWHFGDYKDLVYYGVFSQGSAVSKNT
ncbi:MAG: GNAT family N-acetyltransferase [Lentimicrobium sp.]|jgi:RimJ/RimL family protein N-acetyltransferase|nr:GNAT family N-acetyltransferase [Lentimicrobium sp.]